MSLATRCPSCGTVFRVVRDQLKVSEGWVRCGRCAEVFNAGERLFELEAAAAPATPTPGLQAARGVPPVAVVWPAPAPAPPTGHAEVATPTALIEPDAPRATTASIAEASTDSLPMQPATTPDFVRRADRADRRRQAKWRGALAALSLLLGLLLGAQIALHYRDDLAARWPVSRAWLTGACKLLGCRVEPPRHIESLSVESSALLRIEGSPVHRLSLVVHNRSALAVRMPAIDLVLTDTQGQTTARRVLSGPELGQSADHLPARGEVALQALLDLGEQGVAGYTVELFYP